MKIFRILGTYLFALRFVKCADTSEISLETLNNSEISTETNLQIPPTGSCSQFSIDIWVAIARFLAIPQKELGCLNKESRKAVYENYPYSRFLSDRFDITELEGTDKFDDLILLKDLHYLKDPIEVFMILSNAFIMKKAFYCNQRQIARCIFRKACELDFSTLRHIDPNGSNIRAFAETLIGNGDYELLAHVIETFAFVNYSNLFSSEDDTRLTEIFSKFSQLPFKDEETRILKLHTLAHILASDLIENSNSFVISSAIIAGFPRQSYNDLLDVNEFVFLLDNNSVLAYLSTAPQEKISEFRSVLLENISSKEVFWRTDFPNEPELLEFYLNLLNGKRLLLDIATSDPEEDFYETRIKDQNIFTETLESLFFYSYRAKKHKLTEKLLELLIQTEFEGGYFPLNYYWLKNCPSIYFKYFHLLSEETRYIVCINFNFLEALFYFYNPEKVEISEDFILRIQLSRKKAHYEPILPETFNYSYDIRRQRFDRVHFMSIILKHYKIEDNETFIKLFESIANCPFFYPIGDQQRCFNARVEIFELFFESEKLNEFNLKTDLKFSIGFDHFPLFFQKPRSFTEAFTPIGNVRHIVPKLFTKEQFANLEAITQKDIARIFLEDVSENMNRFSTDLDYYELRIAFRYWYEGPHRQRILEFEFPSFRIKFAREVDTAAERKFLLQGISEEELSQASAATLFEAAINQEEAVTAAQIDNQDQHDGVVEPDVNLV